MTTKKNSSGILSLWEVASRVFAAIFCTALLVALMNQLTAVQTVGAFRIELTSSADVAQPIPVWIGNLLRAGQTATLGTVLVCLGFIGWRRAQSKASK